MKKIKKIIAAAAAAALALSLAACGGNETSTDNGDNSGSASIYRTLDDIKSSGTLKIGVFSDKNPFGYVDNNGEYQGYDVYFAKRLAEDLGTELELDPVEAASRV